MSDSFYRHSIDADVYGHLPLLPDTTPDPYGPRKSRTPEMRHQLLMLDIIIAEENAAWAMVEEGYYGA